MAKTLILDKGVEPIAGYILISQLGEGGFGEVWEASAPGGFRVALKFIRLDRHQQASLEQRALELIRNIRHPHLLDVQFATQVGDRLVIATPLCDQSLLDRLGGWPNGLPREELLGYMDELARAVDYLNGRHHRASNGTLVGVQHRDIKPGNIFLVGGSVRLADFGLAKVLTASRAEHTAGQYTAQYAAPEAILGEDSMTSDQYSLAITYCQLRTGRIPFDEKGEVQLMYAHLHKKPDLSALPEAERAVVARALAKKPEDRWPTCRDFARALAAAQVLPTYSSEETVGPNQPGVGGASSLAMKLVLIPAGEFLMGSPASDQDAKDDEKPQHRVRVTRPFYLSNYQVTQEEYETVMGANPSKFSAQGEYSGYVASQETRRHPVENVSWNDAIAFCNKLSERQGLKPYYKLGAEAQLGGEGIRLPTEAEWEYACRAGSTARYSFGDDAARLGEYAWYDANAGKKTHPVGQKRPNAFGLFDMHGNVWEWCWDGYDDNFFVKSPAVDPRGPAQGVFRVYRGGGWISGPTDLRSACRRRNTRENRGSLLGFRIARDVSSR